MQKYVADSYVEAKAIEKVLLEKHDIPASISKHNCLVSWFGDYHLSVEDWQDICELVDMELEQGGSLAGIRDNAFDFVADKNVGKVEPIKETELTTTR